MLFKHDDNDRTYQTSVWQHAAVVRAIEAGSLAVVRPANKTFAIQIELALEQKTRKQTKKQKQTKNKTNNKQTNKSRNILRKTFNEVGKKKQTKQT